MKNNDNKIKYVIAARKSTESEDRQVLSIQGQTEAMDEIARKFNYSVVKSFTESKSAKKPGREVFDEMMSYIEQGKANGILCWKLDRLARNPIDGGKIIWMLQQGIIKHIRTAERDYYPDDNVILMNVEFGMANQYVLDLGKNVKRGTRQKCEMGWRPGVAPPGYVNEKSADKGRNRIFKDEINFPLIKRAFKLMLSGLYSPMQILDKLNNEWGYRTLKTRKKGGKPMSRSSIYRIFTDTFYYGEFEYGGVMYKGKHEPMITEDEYCKVQELLGKKGRPRPKKREFPFTGFMECGECGGMITAEVKKEKYTYYHCTKRKKDHPDCSQRSIEVKELEKQIDEYLERIYIPQEFTDWAIKHLQELNDDETVNRQVIYESQQKACADLEKQLDNLLSLHLKEQISEEKYIQKQMELQGQLEALRAKMRDTEHTADNWREMTEKTFNFASQARHWFVNGDIKTKKAIFSALGSNFILQDGRLDLKLSKPFEIIEKNLYGNEGIKGTNRKNLEINYHRLEPATISLSKTKTDAFASEIDEWRDGRDSNPRPPA